MKNLLIIAFLCLGFATQAQTYTGPRSIALSQDLLYALKMNASHEEFLKELQGYSMEKLAQELQSDVQKRVYWINIYNAMVQLKLEALPEGEFSKRKFFYKKDIEIAGETMSLQQIEQGVLRNKKALFLNGSFPRLFNPSWVNSFQQAETDYRIHFALNCGAVSCPAIKFYEVEDYEIQMEQSASNFLNQTTTIDGNSVEVSTILKWYKHDFGGNEGLKKLLEKYDLIPASSIEEIQFASYDWTIKAKNYSDE